jgi:hypothetical protein
MRPTSQQLLLLNYSKWLIVGISLRVGAFDLPMDF